MSLKAKAREARAAYLRQVAKTAALRSRLIFWRKKGKRAKKLRAAYIRAAKEQARRKKAYEKAKAAASAPLRVRALTEAKACIGIMESGGNNHGEQVMKIIRANGGTGPEPWCGDFVAHCYRVAGSKIIDRRWASVRLLASVAGLRKTNDPRPGDLVRFNFDHVGIFVKRVNGSTIQTIEGNTGASGAVSDSSTGGDGVYRKNRSTSLVQDYLRVSR